MERQKSVVIPADIPGPRPTIVPHGGIGGLLFWLSVCIFLGISTFYFYGQFTNRDREARALQGDSELLRRENQKLHAVVDQLQTELSQTGSLLRIQQGLLEQSGAESGATEAKKQEPRSQALPSQEGLELRTLEERLDKAFAARVNAKEAMILRQERGVVIAMDYRTLFPGPGLKIGSSGLALLHEIAAGLQPMLRSVEVQVTAFAASSAAPSGLHKSPASDWELSSLRSSAIAKALTDGEHVPAQQVVASCRVGEHPLLGKSGADHGLNAHLLEIGLFLSPDPSGAQSAVGKAAAPTERQDGR
ncbi:hypothetical protein MAMC_01240 [Methylacidimicrobium cyclopophantes]|uniref:OmpA-like domain-containing protein n=1 Tax=Methylacidimicrobium cyclopophantes TaxID=1041766 RepID=A0A5E6MMY4_9BACT|nr:hypothetical protein [Methylacidimicrobium cyclopophantes]VVM06784.1 hypothetical protein MAMC_01240 [Methylacidimicrobium cyclopophantes]